MTPKEKNSYKRKINTVVKSGIEEYGFVKTKDNWFVKPYRMMALFMHLHFFSFDPSIRIHLGYRIYNDDFEAIALNGPSFEGARIDNLINPDTGKLYHFSFSKNSSTANDCGCQIVSFFRNVATPWFESLENSNWAKLSREEHCMVNDKIDRIKVETSLRLLGLKEKHMQKLC